MPRLQLKMLLYTPGVNFAAVLQGEELCYCHKKHPSKVARRESIQNGEGQTSKHLHIEYFNFKK